MESAQPGQETRILEKIKKCLALSASSNEHEAEAALRHARKLMEAHGIRDIDVRAAEAGERRAISGAKKRPPCWETLLAVKVADAFGCQVVFSSGNGFWKRPGQWRFVGCGPSPEVAGYAFSVLLRQAKRARAEHIRSRLGRCKAAAKTRRADLFSDGWVESVVGAISAFCGTAQQDAAINAYFAKHYASISDMKNSDRNAGRGLSDREYADYAAGCRSGQDAQLNRGVGGAGQRFALEGQ